MSLLSSVLPEDSEGSRGKLHRVRGIAGEGQSERDGPGHREVMSLSAWSSSSLIALYLSFWAYSSSVGTGAQGRTGKKCREKVQRGGDAERSRGQRQREEKKRKENRCVTEYRYQARNTHSCQVEPSSTLVLIPQNDFSVMGLSRVTSCY